MGGEDGERITTNPELKHEECEGYLTCIAFDSLPRPIFQRHRSIGSSRPRRLEIGKDRLLNSLSGRGCCFARWPRHHSTLRPREGQPTTRASRLTPLFPLIGHNSTEHPEEDRGYPSQSTFQPANYHQFQRTRHTCRHRSHVSMAHRLEQAPQQAFES